jgi:hypothetical protein
MTETAIYCDLVQPGGEFGLRRKSPGPEISPEKYFLGDVLGILVVRDETKNEI